MKLNTIHYSHFQAKMPPTFADAKGFLHYRDGFEKLPTSERSESERWIAIKNWQVAKWLGKNFT